MKGGWESNVNVWFPFMYSQKWNCTASLFPKQDFNVLSLNSYTHISMRDLYISRIHLYILLQPNMCDRSWGYIKRSETHECGIGIEAAQFPEKENINCIFIAVRGLPLTSLSWWGIWSFPPGRWTPDGCHSIVAYRKKNCLTSKSYFIKYIKFRLIYFTQEDKFLDAYWLSD
jgi:hypothetical protein